MAKCPLCGSVSIIFDPARGEYYCSQCGYVIDHEEIINSQAEANLDYSYRKENAFLLGSTAEFKGKLKKAQEEVDKFFKEDRKRDVFNCGLSEVNRICSQLKVPSYVRREANRIYVSAHKRGIFEKTNTPVEAIAAACVLKATKLYDIHIKFFSIVGISKASKKEISLAIKILKSIS